MPAADLHDTILSPPERPAQLFTDLSWDDLLDAITEAQTAKREISRKMSEAKQTGDAQQMSLARKEYEQASQQLKYLLQDMDMRQRLYDFRLRKWQKQQAACEDSDCHDPQSG